MDAIPLGTAAAAGAALALGIAWQRRRATRDLDTLCERLRKAASRDGGPSDDALPEPVARYLAFAGVGQTAAACPSTVCYAQTGRLKPSLDAAGWWTFEATHLVNPRAHAFAWDARVRGPAGLRLRVQDACVEGRGQGTVWLASTLRMAVQRGSEPVDAGSLHRFLAEAPWYPWALRPSKALRWTPVDDRCARAALHDGGLVVELDFHFRPDGCVEAIRTDGRWGRFGDRFERRPWEGRFAPAVSQGEVRVPPRGEVGWGAGADLRIVWQGEVRRTA